MSWYEKARADIADIVRETGAETDIHTACAVTAAMSPNQSWKGNLTALRRWCETGKARGLRTSLRNVERAERGEPLSGPKVDNFRKALQGDTSAVVVDRWMLRALGIERAPRTERRYEEIADILRRRAAKAGKTPREYQADLWVKVRGRSE
jgi:hypothetical protein